MSTKFYVATTLSNADQAMVVINRLQDFGHELTYNWTTHGLITDKEECVEIALKEIEGVVQCDLLIVIWPGGGGTHVELGVALALGKCVIFIAAEQLEREVSFYQHPNVLRISEISKAIEIAHKHLSKLEKVNSNHE